MRKNLFILFIIMAGHLAIFNSQAQDKLFTPSDAAYLNPSLFPRGLQNIQWIPETNSFTWISGNALLKSDLNSKHNDTLIKASVINTLLIQHNQKAGKSFPSVRWINSNQFTFTKGNNTFVYHYKTGDLKKVCQWPEEATNTDSHQKTFYTAYTINNNLYIAVNEDQIAVSNETNPSILFGSERVHRNEFGIGKGTFWSPEGNFLAFYRMDETMVTDFPLVDIESRPAKVVNTKYPMAGMKIHQIQTGIYDLKNKTVVYLQTPTDEEIYITNITWDPGEKYIYAGILNRGQNHLKVNKYDVKSGALIQTLIEEKNDRYVEPENDLFFHAGLKKQFIWQSERDGYNHLYLYSDNGTLIKQLTKGSWVVKELLGLDENGNHLYFSANKENPIETNIYSLNIKSGTIKNLTIEKGTHSAVFNSDFSAFINSYSNTEIARITQLKKSDSKTLRILQENKNPLTDYHLGQTQLFSLKNKNNDDLYCRIIKPINFDPEKKYPVIVYVYGGPHSQMVTNSWLGGGNVYHNYLAQQGYVVFTLDNRGTNYRGFEFESCIHRNLGIAEMEDQMCGIDWLKSQSFVDSNRIGIDGWSYGGFMTINLLLSYPETFKSATAGGPVTDWKYYEAMYGERYMDTPEENPEGYKNASLLEKVNALQGKLQIIHCTTDPVVVIQHSEDIIKQFIKNDKLIDFFIYPGHEHNVRGADRAHLIRKIIDFHNRNLN